MVYTRLADVPFTRDDLPEMPLPRRVLLTTPAHFSVEYVINPHMAGHVGQTDRAKALAQWNALREAYAHTGVEIAEVSGAPGQPDMVFCANQSLPYVRDDGTRGAILSQMHADERREEVPHYARFFQAEGYETHALDLPGTDFEGMGDALWHPGRRLLWGGYGFRTGLEAYQRVSTLTGAPVLALELLDPEFYHLDTCLSALNARTALYFPGAFQPEGLELLRTFWDTLIEAPEDEARHLFACNAHCPDGRHVLIQRGCTATNERLEEAGYRVVELDTDEYLKSGGSVFCMKLSYW